MEPVPLQAGIFSTVGQRSFSWVGITKTNGFSKTLKRSGHTVLSKSLKKMKKCLIGRIGG
jgi:hypothetical protein